MSHGVDAVFYSAIRVRRLGVKERNSPRVHGVFRRSSGVKSPVVRGRD